MQVFINDFPAPDNMKTPCIPASVVAISLMALSSPLAAATPLLVADAPLKIATSTGGFDFLKIDEARHRLLACHTGNSSMDVFDLADGKLIRHVATGRAQDVAVDSEAGEYFVSVSEEQRIAVVDATSLKVTRTIKLAGAADAIVLDPRTHELYVGHDDEKEVWIVNTRENKVTATVTTGAGPEVVIYDAASDRIFQNIKTDATVLEIDPLSHRILHTWPTAPATAPHGLAYNPETHHLFCAGANSKLVAIDSTTGRVSGSADIAKGVDQIVFDPATHRVYSACGSGKISITEDSATGLTSLGDIDSPPQARTLAYDAKTHSLWLAYGDDKGSYLQRFEAR